MKILADKHTLSGFTDWLSKLINRQLAIIFLAIAVGLSGCVKYDTGINFTNLSDGEIVGRIQLGAQLNSFSQNAVSTWIASVRQRTIQADGHLERLNDREYKITIPFNNPQELVTKIEGYFNHSSPASKIKSQIQIERRNLLLVTRNHLIYDIDLRSLAIDVADTKVSIGGANSIDLDFSISSPWGVKNIATQNAAKVVNSSTRQITWQLKPGKIDRIDAVFWLPNLLALGAVAIALISAIGYYIKYRQLPWKLASK